MSVLTVEEIRCLNKMNGAAFKVRLGTKLEQALNGQIPTGSISTAELADDAVTVDKIAADAVETAQIKDVNVTAAKLATDAVETAKIKDANVTAAKLADAVADRIVGAPTISVAAESGDNVDVTITMKDVQGNTLASRVVCDVWLSDAAGGGPLTTAPDGGVTATTGAVIKEQTSGKVFTCMSDATGALVLRAVESGSKTAYLNIAINGPVTTSAVMTWAA